MSKNVVPCMKTSRIASSSAGLSGCCTEPTVARRGSALPGVVLGGGLVAGEDVVELGQRGFVEFDLEGTFCRIQLFHSARPDDRRGHGRLVQQPGQRDVARLEPTFLGEILELPDLFAVVLYCLRRTTLIAPLAVPLLPQDS